MNPQEMIMRINELKRQKRIHGLSDKITTLELKKLKQDMPLQKIIGFINFDGLVININYHVFIPRYETEEVVLHALKYINKNSKVLDLCCGSGYIGLTIKQKTDADVTLADCDDEALLQTQENAKFNQLNVKIIKSNLFDNIDGKFDVIVSNPPYIATQTTLPISIRKYEPKKALFGGESGDVFYKKIIANLEKHIVNNGYIIFEIAPHNVSFLAANGFEILFDINQKARIAIKKIEY